VKRYLTAENFIAVESPEPLRRLSLFRQLATKAALNRMNGALLTPGKTGSRIGRFWDVEQVNDLPILPAKNPVVA
jgi:hypothetical protein